MKALPVILLLLVVLTTNCSNRRQQVKQKDAAPIALLGAADTSNSAPSEFETIIDSLLHQHTCIRDYKPVTAWQTPELGIGAQEDSGAFAAIWVDNHRFEMSKLEVLQQDDSDMRTRSYQIDSAFTFSFAGQRWAWLEASNYMCNGSGCRDAFYFLADFRLNRLYAFSVFNAPGTGLLIGNLDKDSSPVILIPKTTPWPPIDTGLSQSLRIDAWQRDTKGHWKPARRGRKNIQFTLTYDDDANSVSNMRIAR